MESTFELSAYLLLFDDDDRITERNNSFKLKTGELRYLWRQGQHEDKNYSDKDSVIGFTFEQLEQIINSKIDEFSYVLDIAKDGKPNDMHPEVIKIVRFDSYPSN